jgi:hypothetical protein
LRAYLRDYPEGAYAAEAQVQLASCQRERVEAPGAVDDRRYPRWLVNRSAAHALATEAEARADAQQRGSDDARATCASFGLTDRLVSASVAPVTWDCREVEHRFVCGFEGDQCFYEAEALKYK